MYSDIDKHRPPKALDSHERYNRVPGKDDRPGDVAERSQGDSLVFFRGKCRVSVANCFELRHKAYRFQYQKYEKLGIVRPDPDAIWLTIHDALPPTTTFIASDNLGKLAGTLTLVFDSAIGLPADSLYPFEMKAIRRDDAHHVCELISFGTSQDSRGSVKILAGLLYCSYLFAMHIRKVTDYVITVHQRLEKFYCSNLLFSRLGPVRNYDKVNGEPTVLLTLNLGLPERLRQSRRIFPLSLFSYSRADELAIASRIDQSTAPLTSCEFTSLFRGATDVWRKATAAQKEYIRSIYAADLTAPPASPHQ